MSIRNILVAFTGDEGSHAALRLAMRLALDHGAHVTGILTHGLPTAMYAYGTHLPQTAVAQLESADKEHREEVKAAFFAAATELDPDKTHYLDVYGDANLKLIEVARTYDLIVMAPPNGDSAYPHMQAHSDVIARDASRPVLLAPVELSETAMNDHVLLAWDCQAAASRALADAMPLIRGRQVTVMSVAASDEEMQGINRLMAHLERHGIAAGLKKFERKTGRIGDMILTTAQEIGAGLIVMGAYEHSKFAEDLFGGTTNRVLARSTLPVLMAH